MSCQCLKRDGNRCTNRSRPGSKYCGIHKNCRSPRRSVSPKRPRRSVSPSGRCSVLPQRRFVSPQPRLSDERMISPQPSTNYAVYNLRKQIYDIIFSWSSDYVRIIDANFKLFAMVPIISRIIPFWHNLLIYVNKTDNVDNLKTIARILRVKIEPAIIRSMQRDKAHVAQMKRKYGENFTNNPQYWLKYR